MPDALVDEIALVGSRDAHRRPTRGVARERRHDARPAGAPTGGAAGARGAHGLTEAVRDGGRRRIYLMRHGAVAYFDDERPPGRAEDGSADRGGQVAGRSGARRSSAGSRSTASSRVVFPARWRPRRSSRRVARSRGLARARGAARGTSVGDPRRTSSRRRSCTPSAASSRTRSASSAARRSGSSSIVSSRPSSGSSPTRPGTRCCSSSTAPSTGRSSRTRSPVSGCSSVTSSRRPAASTSSTSVTAGSSVPSTSTRPTSPIALPGRRRWRGTGSSTGERRDGGRRAPERGITANRRSLGIVAIGEPRLRGSPICGVPTCPWSSTWCWRRATNVPSVNLTSFSHLIGNWPVTPVRCLTPGSRNGFAWFQFRYAFISEARVGFLPARVEELHERLGDADPVEVQGVGGAALGVVLRHDLVVELHAASFAHFGLAGSFAYCVVKVRLTRSPPPFALASVRNVSVAETEFV